MCKTSAVQAKWQELAWRGWLSSGLTLKKFLDSISDMVCSTEASRDKEKVRWQGRGQVQSPRCASSILSLCLCKLQSLLPAYLATGAVASELQASTGHREGEQHETQQWDGASG